MRDAWIIGTACVLAILIGGWLFFFSDAESIRVSDSEVAYEVLAEGTSAGTLTTRTNYLVTGNEQFAEVWEKLHPVDTPPVPAVNFATTDIIIVLDGTHASGGFDIDVVRITDVNDTRTVTIRHTEPGAECVLTSAVTSPYQIVALPRADGSIQRIDESVTTSCN